MSKRHTKSSPSPAAPEDSGDVDPSLEGAEPPAVSNLESYLEDHRGKIAILGIVAVVAIAVTAWVVYSRSAKEKEAAVEFTRASTVPDYNLVIERHAGTVAGGNAAIMKAKIQWDSGEQTASLKTLNQFVGNFPDHPLKAQGLYAIAVREAAMENPDKAKQRLNEVIEKHADSAVAPLAQLYLADMALGEGDVETARGLYDTAAKMDPAVVGAVERRIETINAKTPIVAIEAPPLPKEEVKPPLDPVVPPLRPPVDPTTPPVPPTTPPVPPTTPPVPLTTPPVPPTTPPVPPPTPPVPPTTPPVPPTTPPVPPTTPPVPPTTPPVPPTTPTTPTTPPVPPTTPPVPPTTPPPVEPTPPPVEPTPPVDPAPETLPDPVETAPAPANPSDPE